MSSEFNELYMNNRIQGKLEGRGFEALDMVLLFLPAFVDQVTWEDQY